MVGSHSESRGETLRTVDRSNCHAHLLSISRLVIALRSHLVTR